MRPIPLAFALLTLAACGSRPAPPAQERRQPPAQAAAPRAQPPLAAADAPSGAGAADMLQRYYARIEARDYDAAWRMRSGGGARPDAARFAADFKAYEHYEAQVGTPSLTVRSGDWDYVEVPVMITGRFIGGKPFGNSGSVTLRRPAAGSSSAGGWRIYTG